MDAHRCKLCFRDFANGKALGGHMRSHMMFLDAPKESRKDDDKSGKDQVFDEVSDEFQSSSSTHITSSDEESEEIEEGMVLSNESSKKDSLVCKRSKRVRRTEMNGFFQVKKMNLGVEEQGKSNEHSSLSSISETTPEENAAHCLIMLSRDKWNRVEEEVEEKEYYEEKVVKTTSSKFRGKYKCETCNKLFKSYQALGGHRTSHKKFKAETSAARMVVADSVVPGEKKKYECPFCDRVFDSGQAFGGHKRSHFVGAGAISSNRNVEAVARIDQVDFELDLNMPAPVEEEGDYEISQVEISAVSDA